MSRGTSLSRRRFLSRSAFAAAATGLSPALPASAFSPSPAAPSPVAPGARFDASPGQPDADVFAAARKHFLFPENVTYCNTGTLGASPREVVEAMNRGVEDLERQLPDWPYFQADGEPLTGYQELLDVRTEIAKTVGAAADEIA
ncbi:MAG TPA: hypothetical protein VK911_11465, partial [Vicinamibacterales bacterium]|nr:hypothetical protein [Vicinamibacterales bacterium]